MPVYTSEALILRTYKLGESDRIVVFLTRDRGKKRGVAKGARRAKSRYIGALEPMTRAGVAYYEREMRDLVRINYVEPQRSPLSAIGLAGSGASVLGHVGYFAELIDEWAPEAHADERLYRLGSSVVDALAAGAPIDRLARYFEYWILRLQGVYPALMVCPGCGGALEAGAVMPPREHMFLCRRCAAGRARHRHRCRRPPVPASGRADRSGTDGHPRARCAGFPRARNGAPAPLEYAPGEGAQVGSRAAGDGKVAES